MRPGDIIENKYEVIRKIASAGFGTVYEGWDLVLDRPVAIKSILANLAEEEKFIKMFMDEAVHTAKLTHENIVQVHDLVTTADKQLYIVMQLIDGKNLREIMKRVKELKDEVPVDLIAFVMSRVCAALRYAHEAKDARTGNPLGIVHRDVSPANIMVDYDGIVKLMDFGIAKGEQRKTEVTKTGVLKGKISYMSPEQAMGQPVDPQSDVYSLGIIMFEMLAGERPFKGSNDLEILQKVARGKIDKTPLEKEKIPHKLRDICLKALEKDKHTRYKTAQEMYVDLHAYFSSIDSMSLQSRLSLYMRQKFDFEIKDRDNLPPVAKIEELRRETKAYEGKTVTATAPISKAEKTRAATVQIPTISIFKVFLPILIIALVAGAGYLAYQNFQSKQPIAFLETIPNGATVFINGQKLGETPLPITKFAAGSYNLIFRLPGFEELSHEAIIDDVSNFKIEDKVGLNQGNRTNVFTLPFTATFKIDTKPSRATVFIDNENVGTSPLQIKKQLSTDMTLTIERDGFEAPNKMVINWLDSNFGSTEGWKISKFKVNGGEIGYNITGSFLKKVTITSVPEHSLLYIDGQHVGPTPYEAVLPFGEHTFRADNGNLSSGDEIVEIVEKTDTIKLLLKQQLRFIAQNTAGQNLDANVSIRANGKRITGKSGDYLPVPSGNYKATFSKSGYYEKTVSFNSVKDTLIIGVLRVVKPKVKAIVTDIEGNPVSGATVSYRLGDGAYRTTSSTTNYQGVVTIDVEPGRNYFKAEKNGIKSPELPIISGNSGTKEAPLRLLKR